MCENPNLNPWGFSKATFSENIYDVTIPTAMWKTEAENSPDGIELVNLVNNK